MLDRRLPSFALLGLIFLGAAFLRFHELDYRPMHGDEANQAMKTGVLLETGDYAYDPFEHHGPTLYYLTLPILWMNGVDSKAGMTETMIRVLPACFGLGLVLLSYLMAAPIDRRAGLLAAVLTAISHGLVYYSRYYIQEISFVFFAGALVWCGYYYLRTRRLGWALGVGLFLGLLHATKETSVLVVVAMLGALAGLLLLERVLFRGTEPANDDPEAGTDANLRTPLDSRVRGKDAVGGEMALEDSARPASAGTPAAFAGAGSVPPYFWHLAGALGIALVVSVVFFSSFFTHWRGPLDSLLTYGTYLGRAEGDGSTAVHEQPWYYYLWVLGWYYREAGPKWTEGLVLGLAAVGAACGVWRPLGNGSYGAYGSYGGREPAEDGVERGTRHRALLERFLVFYTLLLVVGFSVIPYKTPWNLLIFLHPLCLLGGLGAYRLLIAVPRWWWRVAVSLLLAAGSLQLLGQTWRGIFTYSADVRNPYVYAHTSSAIRRLTERVADLAEVHPRGNEILIKIFRPGDDYWPLPWYFRMYPNVGYYRGLAEDCDADVVLTSPEVAGAVQQCLKDEYHVENNGLRPGVLMPTFIRRSLWDAFMAERMNQQSTGAP